MNRVALFATISLLIGCQSNSNQKATQPSATIVTFPKRSQWDGALLDMLRNKASRCGDEVWMANPETKSKCDWDVLFGTFNLLHGSKANFSMSKLAGDISDPLMMLRGGERSVRDELVVSGAFAVFALDRAAILRGVPPLRTDKPHYRPEAMFNWVRDRTLAKNFSDRWNAIRAEDCRAYPVQNCAARLDQSMARVMNVIHLKMPPRPEEDALTFRENFGSNGRSKQCLRRNRGDYWDAYRTCLFWYMDETFDPRPFTKNGDKLPPPKPSALTFKTDLPAYPD